MTARRTLGAVAAAGLIAISAATLAGSQETTTDREKIQQAYDLLGEVLNPPTTVAPTTIAPTTNAPTTAAPTTTTAPASIPAASLDATNTGWRGCGITESDLTDTGSLVIDSTWPRAIDGRIYVERRDVTGFIDVKVPDVTIRCTRVRHGGRFAGVRARYDAPNNASGLLVEWTELDGQGVCGSHAGISSAQTVRYVTARRVDVHGSEDGLNLQAASVLEQSYVHDLSQACGNEHPDGMQNSGTESWHHVGPVIVRDSKIIGRYQTSTSAVRHGTTQGPITNFVVERNWLSGGSYTVYADQVSFPISGVVRNNVFVLKSSGVWRASCASSVNCSNLDPHDPGYAWRLQGSTTATGNVWDDGVPIPDR